MVKVAAALSLLVLLSLMPAAALGQPSPPAARGASPEGAAPKEEALNITLENALSVRDPFRRPVLTGEAGDTNEVPELERYDVDKLKVVGVITGPNKPKAMITSPSGKMVMADEQMRIGNRHGVIKKILPGMVAIEEKVVNLLGQEESIETVLEYNPVKEKEKEKK